MSRVNRFGILLIIVSVIFWCGCNDAFRPIAQIIPEPGPDPQRQNNVLVVSTNTSGMPSALSTIDVSGDSVASVQYVGVKAVQAVAIGGRGFTLNQGGPSITSLIPANFTFQPVTIPLPNTAVPTSMYAAVPNFLWVAEGPRNMVAQVQILNGTLQAEIPVGNNPSAVTQMPNGDKVYAANQADNTVSVIRAANQTVVGTIAVGPSPVGLVASSDSRFIFVANEGDSTITVIDTTNDGTALTTIPVGGSPGCAGELPCFSMTYDSGLKRLYVVSRTTNTVTILRADQPLPTLPTVMTTIDVNADATCVGSSPRQVAVLPDGSRAYVVNAGSNNVCVINTLNNTISKSIPVGDTPVSIGTSADGAKVYTANSGSNNISVIRTSLDAEITDQNNVPFRIPAPRLDPNCQDPPAPAPPTCALQSPIYVTR